MFYDTTKGMKHISVASWLSYMFYDIIKSIKYISTAG